MENGMYYMTGKVTKCDNNVTAEKIQTIKQVFWKTEYLP